jgi:hypothetical protein
MHEPSTMVQSDSSYAAVVRVETATADEAAISFWGQQQLSQLTENMRIHPVRDTHIIQSASGGDSVFWHYEATW